MYRPWRAMSMQLGGQVRTQAVWRDMYKDWRSMSILGVCIELS